MIHISLRLPCKLLDDTALIVGHSVLVSQWIGLHIVCITKSANRFATNDYESAMIFDGSLNINLWKDIEKHGREQGFDWQRHVFGGSNSIDHSMAFHWVTWLKFLNPSAVIWNGTPSKIAWPESLKWPGSTHRPPLALMRAMPPQPFPCGFDDQSCPSTSIYAIPKG